MGLQLSSPILPINSSVALARTKEASEPVEPIDGSATFMRDRTFECGKRRRPSFDDDSAVLPLLQINIDSDIFWTLNFTKILLVLKEQYCKRT